MDWLWQALISNVVWELLGMIGLGVVLAFVKKKLPEHAAAIGYAIFGITCGAILIMTSTGHGIFVKTPSEVTAENVEENVRKWSDNAGFGITKMSSQTVGKDIYFGFVLTLADGNPITVFRGKEKSGFIQIQIPLVLSQEHLAMLGKLSKNQADSAIEGKSQTNHILASARFLC